MSAPLAVLTMDGITPDRFSRLQAAAEQFFGTALTGTSGTASKEGVTASYAYDAAKQELVFNVLHEDWLAARLEGPTKLQNDLLAWVDSVK